MDKVAVEYAKRPSFFFDRNKLKKKNAVQAVKWLISKSTRPHAIIGDYSKFQLLMAYLSPYSWALLLAVLYLLAA